MTTDQFREQVEAGYIRETLRECLPQRLLQDQRISSLNPQGLPQLTQGYVIDVIRGLYRHAQLDRFPPKTYPRKPR